MRASDAPCLHLAFGDHVHELDAAQQYPGTTELLEGKHRPRASLDCPMILLDNIVQILLLANLDRSRTKAGFRAVIKRPIVRSAGVT